MSTGAEVPASSAAAAAGTRQDLSDGGCVPHDPNLYAHSAVAESCGALDCNSALVAQYRRHGLLVFDAFQDKVDNLDEAIESLTNGRNKEFAAHVKAHVESGQTPNFTSGAKIPWVQYEAGTTVGDSLLQPEIAYRVRKLMGFVGYEKAIDSLVHDETLLKLVSRLLDCKVEQVKLFQDMALLKPRGGREKPWHQDKAYFDIGAGTKVVGCWIAIDEATCENGCLRMMRGGHVNGPMMHFSKRDYQICDKDAPTVEKGDDIVAVPLPPGGLVLFDGMIPHGTPTNMSPDRRRALQFHWIKRDSPIVPQHVAGGRAEVFGGAPNGLSC